jgi:hypothetical protein
MHAVEVLCSFILVTYLVNFILGKRLNSRLAHRWLDTVKQVIVDNFSVVG